MQTSVRLASTADGASLAAVYAAASASLLGAPNAHAEHFRDDAVRFSAMVQDNAGLVHIAEVDGSVAGYVALQNRSHPSLQSESPLRLWQLYVQPAFHGKGIASRLMSVVFDLPSQHGNDVVWLGVSAHNARGIAFYRKHGSSRAGFTTSVLEAMSIRTS